MNIDTFDRFNPFGEGVRIGAYGNAGNADIHANMKDLCSRYSVPYKQARALTYPNGSLLLLQIAKDELATELYLSEDAYPVFMRWALGGVKP